ncbi:MAG: protoheme IX farnesyltransferase, partial [Planctomycetes bacterium]|nr:protoheme IX farnesyltransferase [Planctomycetota bacterium]
VHWLARTADFIELTKPRIAALVLVTVAIAAFVAGNGLPDPWLLVHTLLGTSLVAASASAWNQLLERRTDALMDRTSDRPLPAGRLGGRAVVWFGLAAVALGVAYLALAVSLATAALGMATWIAYVALYTPLKSRSSLNTAVGAVAGAMPVLMGWTAGGGRLGLEAATLFLMVFLWQFPHFMAIAWMYREQYARAGLQMMTVVDPTGMRAGRQAVIAALALVPVSLLPALLGIAGGAYFVWALLLGVGQTACAVAFWYRLDEAGARLLLRTSLVYLPSVLLSLVLDPLLL